MSRQPESAGDMQRGFQHERPQAAPGGTQGREARAMGGGLRYVPRTLDSSAFLSPSESVRFFGRGESGDAPRRMHPCAWTRTLGSWMASTSFRWQ